MEPTGWAAEHSEELRRLLAKGASYAQAAAAINVKFGTGYTRSAALGRAKRMGSVGLDRRLPMLSSAPHLQPDEIGEPPPLAVRPSEFHWSIRPPVFQRVEQTRLRCAEVDPRRLSLLELERNDCRYPYGGDEEGETISFCGHPRRKGSSYCPAHFELTIDPVDAEESVVSAAPLELVDLAGISSDEE